ncbi:MAG: MFS transporter [Kangiellaceae bacterium]|nr:MFS transporter [Kangiellaceae bacterium]
MTNSMDKKLFFIANLSIFIIGMGFAVRANIANDLQTSIFDAIDSVRSATMVGQALGITFTGFAFTLLFGSAIVDFIGSKKMLVFSALSYLLGSSIVVFASLLEASWAAYYIVLSGLLMTGLGWGAVEAAVNPVVATIDPKNKVKRLNLLHAWWPAGIVVGGLLGVLLDSLNASWQFNLLALILPSILLLVLVLKVEFPLTERVISGVSYLDMFKELYRKPQFIIFWCCMWLTTTSELAPGQWVDLSLSKIVGFKGILILVYVSSLMFVMRHFAGAIAKQLSTVGLLWFSSLFAAIGLYGLSVANGPVNAFFAATVWGIGVCYMWPTMLATVSERFPKGGALFLGLMGFGGGMAIQFALPKLGAIFDQAKIEAAGGLEQLALLSGEQLEQVQKIAAVESFQSLVYIPVLLLPVFGVIWFYDHSRQKKLAFSN